MKNEPLIALFLLLMKAARPSQTASPNDGDGQGQ